MPVYRLTSSITIPLESSVQGSKDSVGRERRMRVL